MWIKGYINTKLLPNFSYIKNVVFRNHRFSYRLIKGAGYKQAKVSVVGMIRLRNESLILEDTLDHLSNLVDGIVIYDDASTDDSVEIARKHNKVIEVVANKKWRASSREWEETANRALLYKRAKKFSKQWLFYLDTDERFEGDIYDYLVNRCHKDVNGIKISLFDAYITAKDKKDYTKGAELYNFRKYFGIERRDILMIWKTSIDAKFKKPDLREPQGISGTIETKFYCQHYGKALSIQHWEDTCNYYVKNFPKYSEKWAKRMGRAIHNESDFGTRLYPWESVKVKAVKIN